VEFKTSEANGGIELGRGASVAFVTPCIEA